MFRQAVQIIVEFFHSVFVGDLSLFFNPLDVAFFFLFQKSNFCLSFVCIIFTGLVAVFRFWWSGFCCWLRGGDFTEVRLFNSFFEIFFLVFGLLLFPVKREINRFFSGTDLWVIRDDTKLLTSWFHCLQPPLISGIPLRQSRIPTTLSAFHSIEGLISFSKYDNSFKKL